jgi:hypothetical protein
MLVCYGSRSRRDIPWLLIMELTLQPGANFAKIRWDRSPTDKESSEKEADGEPGTC